MINNSREVDFAETVFEREQRREKQIKDALKLEAERHETIIKNMHRLRTLRLERDKTLSRIWSCYRVRSDALTLVI
jgi:hypothetical protein